MRLAVGSDQGRAGTFVSSPCSFLSLCNFFFIFSHTLLRSARIFDILVALSATKAGRVKGDLAGSSESALAFEIMGRLFAATLRVRVCKLQA